MSQRCAASVLHRSEEMQCSRRAISPGRFCWQHIPPGGALNPPASPISEAIAAAERKAAMRALMVLVDDGVISHRRAREIAGWTVEEQRQFWRDEFEETIADAIAAAERRAVLGVLAPGSAHSLESARLRLEAIADLTPEEQERLRRVGP